MYRLTIGNNVSRRTVDVNPNDVVRKYLESYNVNYSNATMHLDGVPLTNADLNRTFADLGVTNNAYLIAVVKADNAK